MRFDEGAQYTFEIDLSWQADPGASDMFSHAGYRVLEAGTAAEALRLLEANADIRLLFTDVSMPGSMSGADLACDVAKRWPAIGIIVTSGRPRPGELPSSMHFHDKPYEPTAGLRQPTAMTIRPASPVPRQGR